MFIVKRFSFAFAVLFLYVVYSAGAQTASYPKGLYLTVDELLNKTPSKQHDLTIVQRTQGDIYMNGGNEYKLVSPDKSLKKGFIKKEILAVSDGSDLYLNGFAYDCQIWYMKAHHFGKDILFYGAVPSSEAITAAMVGGAIGAAISASKNYVYMLNKNAELIGVTKRELLALLANKPELLAQYKKEKDPKNPHVIMKYAVILNQ